MSDFDKAEWMAENNRREGDSWEPLKAGKKPDLEYCDIRLRDGKELGPCWPNGKDFVELETEKVIPASGIIHIRYYENSLVPSENEEEDEGDEETGFLPEMSPRRGRRDDEGEGGEEE